MKFKKAFGLLAVTSVAMLAVVASASATSVTTTTGGAAATPTIHAVSEGGHVTISNPIAEISCSSTVEGSVEQHGPDETVAGTIIRISYPNCTNSWHVTTEATSPIGHYGTMTVHYKSGYDAVVTSSHTRVATTRFGILCVYETNETSIGTLTGGNPATLHIEASLPIDTEVSSGLCGSSNAMWEGSYVTTSALYVTP